MSTSTITPHSSRGDQWSKLLSPRRLRHLLERKKTAKKKRPPEKADKRADMRSEFEKDHGRAIFSAPFRRLQDKTQVFPLDPGDIVRTRLTHSMEVSSIARSLGASVATWLQERGEITTIADARAIEFICATCGLLHDLGNPPFGHPGEKAISDWIKSSDLLKAIGDTTITLHEKHGIANKYRGDFICFNGNAQTFRLVTKLQILADFYGLNLTAATLAALLKYTASSSDLDEKIHERSKLGYFQSEANIVNLVWKEVGLKPRQRHPLTYLVEAADDIAYSAVDVEDAVRKGVISWDYFIREMPKSKLRHTLEYMENYIQDTAVRSNLQLDQRNRGEANIQLFRTHSIIYHTGLALDSFKRHYDEIMAGEYHAELLADEECRSMGFIKELKTFAKNNIWHTRDNVKLEILGCRVIGQLLDIFSKAEPKFVEFKSRKLDLGDHNTKLYTVLSSNYRRVYEHFHCSVEEDKRLDSRYLRLQLLADYICGMSDGFAVNLYNELHGLHTAY